MQKKIGLLTKKKNFQFLAFRGVRPPCPPALNFSLDDTRFYIRNLKYVCPVEPYFSINFCCADLNGVGMFICHLYWKMSISILLFIVNVMKKKIATTAIRIAPFVIYFLWFVWFQGFIVKQYPAKFRLTIIQCLFSFIQSGILAIAMERNPSAWKIGWDIHLLSVAYCVSLSSYIIFISNKT